MSKFVVMILATLVILGLWNPPKPIKTVEAQWQGQSIILSTQELVIGRLSIRGEAIVRELVEEKDGLYYYRVEVLKNFTKLEFYDCT